MFANLFSIPRPLSGAEFLTGWLPAMTLTVAAEPAVDAVRWIVVIEGQELPVVTAILAALGVLAARPLARAQERTLPLWQFLLVTAIMLLVVELWVINSQPGWLFAFVMAIGLGFSGYSLIELLGEEIRGVVKSAFTLMRGRIGTLLGKSKDSDDV